MFYRKVINGLREWAAQEKRKPLILRGARQVGKTTAVNMFSEDFDLFVPLNLEEKKDAEIFERNLPLEDLIQAIFLSKNLSFSKNKKILLFIDEIQVCSPAMAMMRYFYEAAPNLHVIAAGSLLEAAIGNRHISFPVGRVQYLYMFPLIFEEFLIAMGEEKAVQLYHQVPMPEYAFQKLLQLFHKYVLLGGMPEVIQEFIKNRDIVGLTPIYQSLMIGYMEDVRKYARSPAMVEVIRSAIESAPFEAGKRIKFQGFGQSNYKSREMSEALKTLERVMLAYLLFPITVTQPPLKADYKKSPRLQFLDTGLLNYVVGLQDHFFKFQDLYAFYQGTLAEHIVGQELLAMDTNRLKKISFWVREDNRGNAEVDFVIPFQHLVIPVEVKAGKTGTLRSLHQYIERSPHPYAVRLYAGPLQITEASTPDRKPYKLLNLPYFLASKINDYLQWYIEDIS